MTEKERKKEVSSGGDGLSHLLKSLERDELLEVLSAGDGLCRHCSALLETRARTLATNSKVSQLSLHSDEADTSEAFGSSDISHIHKSAESVSVSSRTCWQESSPLISARTPQSVYSSGRKHLRPSNSSPVSAASVNNKKNISSYSSADILLNDGLSKCSLANGLTEDEKEQVRFAQVRRKKDFVYNERVNGRLTNVLHGLELHTGVFNSEEQKTIVECVYQLRDKGRRGELRERTYSEPRKWMRGKGRVTIQFGCCYNYAVDRDGNPPGIIRDEEVDPLPNVFKKMIKRMVRWQVLPPTCIPDSCIVNIYDEGDCIPPHIDHHDFLRPFCTVSFLAECNILFGSNLKILSPGEFSGPVSIALPVGSVLILNGNGADVAKHCVPSVPAKRISITFRKMDDSKLPYKFLPDPDLVGLEPMTHSQHRDKRQSHSESVGAQETQKKSFLMEKDDFPPLGSLASTLRR